MFLRYGTVTSVFHKLKFYLKATMLMKIYRILRSSFYIFFTITLRKRLRLRKRYVNLSVTVQNEKIFCAKPVMFQNNKIL